MAEYIDRETAKRFIAEKGAQTIVSKFSTTKEFSAATVAILGAMFSIDDVPTADVAEVRHGRWIIDTEHSKATCSECGKILRFSDESQIAFLHDEERFCYYCGADMRGGKHETL